jgi:probable HAF family extracellular repeat protein
MHATLWPAAGHAPHDLGTLSGGTYSEAAAINTAGDIVGLGEDGFMNTQAVLWPAAGRVPVVLKSLGGRYNRAYGINDNGDIVGMSQDASGYYRATLWPAAGRLPVDLGTVGGTFGTASSINAAGDIVGVSTDVGESRHATVWAGTGAGTVPSTCKSGASSRSRSDHSERSEHSNNSDRSDRSDRRRATTASALAPVSASATAARVPVDLGLLAGGFSSQATSLNASGQIVGFGDNAYWEQRAMSWKSLSTTPPPAPGGTPGRDHEGNHQNEGDEDGDC